MSNLSLEFARSHNGKTYLEKQYASYPYHICRAQYYENDPSGMANIYIQSASGGIYENESLTTNIVAKLSSFSHVTTQASTIVHGMNNGEAHQTVNVNATQNAYTEYVADPLILFPESKLSSTINVYADETSTAVIADSFIIHFLNGEDQLFNQLRSCINIYTEKLEILAKDVYLMNPKNFLSNMHKFIGMGTISIINRSSIKKGLLESLQINLRKNESVYGGATYLPNGCGIIIKFLSPDGDILKKTLIELWILIRKAIVGIKPKVRRK